MDNGIVGSRNQLFESTYNESLMQNELNESHWKNFKQEHEALSSRLLSLRDKLKHDIMVPIGKLALMKGRLIHTNEILVSLGDGWFAKKSTSEAAEVCKRRIEDCDQMLDKIKKERDLLTSRRTFPIEHDLFSNEIIEPYDEVAEAEWRVKHRERVKAHKQEEARKKQENKIKDEKDIFELLDVLELQEEEEDELNRLGLEAEYANGDDDSETEDFHDGYEENEDKIEMEIGKDEINGASINYYEDDNCTKINTVKNREPINNFTDLKNNSLNMSSCIKRSNGKNSHKVSFAEDTNEQSVDDTYPIVIHFKHSDILPVSYNNSNESIIIQNINSPSDIYKSSVHSTNLLKSILKKSVPPRIKECVGDKRLVEEDETIDDIRSKRGESISQVKIGDITERSQVPSSQISARRTVSRFKEIRQVAKK